VLSKKDKHLAAAQRFVERGQDHRALEEFARVVHEDPGDARTWLKMAEIHARHGAIGEAREIYLRTADLYTGQGYFHKAVTVYRTVLKLTPGLPAVRLRLAEAYRQLGMLGDAMQELEQAVAELGSNGTAAEVLPALRRMVELHPDNVVTRIRLAEAASHVGRLDEAIGELSRAAEQLKMEGRADEYVRVAERLLHHQPQNFAVARELAATYISRNNPRLALAKLHGALQAAPRAPENVSLLAQAMALLDIGKAVSVWRELAEIHADAGRTVARDEAVRAGLALDPSDAECHDLAARWGIPLAMPTRARPPTPAASSLVPHADAFVPRAIRGERSGPVPSGSGPILSGTTPAVHDAARILAEAEVFVKYGLGERAVDHLRRIFVFDPKHRRGRERLAAVLAQLGRRGQAAAELAALAHQLRAADDADAARVAERALGLDPTCEAAAEVLRQPRLTPEPPPSAAGDRDEDLLGELEQLDFFERQSLHEDAQAVLVDLEQRYPGHPLVVARRRALTPTEAGAVPVAPGAEPSGSEERPLARLSPSENADPTTHGDLGIAYKQMGLHDAAIAEFRKLARDRTRAVFALTMIGECIEAKGELGEAVARYKEAVNLPQATPQESVELYYRLGSVFEQVGDVREALYFFENVGKRNPDFRDVKQRVEALKTTNERQTS
jgi:tetratricopeptide (TPR) repeat protein